MDKQFSKSAGRRGVKKFLLSQGVQMCDMREFLTEFLTKYGHTELETKTLAQLQDKGALFFLSLKRYTYGKRRN